MRRQPSLRSVVIVALVGIGLTFFAVDKLVGQEVPLRQPISVAGAPNVMPGITVMGRGVVRVPPDRMRIVVHFFQARVSSAPSAPSTPSLTMPVDDVGRLVAQTMRANGVPDAQWQYALVGNFTPATTSGFIEGTIAKPTRESVEAIARKIFASLPESLSTSGQNAQIQISLQLDDCAAAEARAQQAAMADAHARAAATAHAFGVRLGPIFAVNESQTFPSPACDTQSENAGVTFNGGTSGTLSVPITVTATVTYALR